MQPKRNEIYKIRLPALHYSVNFIFLSFGIMGFIAGLWNYKRVTDEAQMAETS